jgi:hypothetical protein
MKIIKFFICIFWPFPPIDWICWFSKYFWDIHDYYRHRGGDGVPMHFVKYKCWNCNKEFTI